MESFGIAIKLIFWYKYGNFRGDSQNKIFGSVEEHLQEERGLSEVSGIEEFMAKLEDVTRGAAIKGILPDGLVTVVDVKWIGSVAIELTRILEEKIIPGESSVYEACKKFEVTETVENKMSITIVGKGEFMFDSQLFTNGYKVFRLIYPEK